MRKNNAIAYKHPFDQSDLHLNTANNQHNVVAEGVFSSKTGDQFEINDGIPDLTWPKELAKIDEETRTTYETLANNYEKYADIPFKTFKTPESNIRHLIVDKLNIKSSSKVLEIGAGDGRGSEYIVKELGEQGSLFVQELSSAFLHKAIERLKPHETKTNIEYSIANAIYLPFADNQFDAAHHFGGISTFSDVGRCLREMVRVVKPGGKIVVGDESMGKWLRETEFGKIMMNSNPLFKFEIPFDLIPVEARNVKVEWIMMGAFFLLEFEVGEGAPEADYFVPIPSARGGNHWIRYYGHLEGVTDETKKLAYDIQRKSGKSMHQWLDDLIKDFGPKTIDNAE